MSQSESFMAGRLSVMEVRILVRFHFLLLTMYTLFFPSTPRFMGIAIIDPIRTLLDASVILRVKP